MIELDRVDRRLLMELQRDDRVSYADLGREVGLSISGVNARLKKLIAAGLVRRFAAQLDPAVAGLDLCAFVQVVLDRPEHDAPFIAAVQAIPAILECHHVTGDFSYLLKVRVRNTAELERLLSAQVKQLPGVNRTHTLIALSSPKETTVLELGAE
ncbi:MAG: Lrp/AsnC family transcriptional regulator [Thermomicrobiales bacterium]|nr:Lrp/AsnC family transcriptional regulator [Thermomicrobiales bacterium]